MKILTTNTDNLKDSQMTEVVKRVKILLINSKNEVLLAHSHNDYQFPGGHIEDGETYIEAVRREIKEETGIVLSDIIKSPFALKQGYYKDWPSEGKNRKIEIYYYEIFTDEIPNLKKMKLTDNEKNGDFKLEYIPLKNVKKVLKENTKQFGDKYGIAKEMIELLDVYKQLNSPER